MNIMDLLSQPCPIPPAMDAEHSALVERQKAEFDEALKTLCHENAKDFAAMNVRHADEHRALREKYGL